MTSYESAVRSYEDDQHMSRLGIVARRSYRLEPQRRASLLPSTLPFTFEPLYSDVTAVEDVRLRADSDTRCFLKPFTDVILVGTAYSSRGSVRWLETALELGAVKKTVRVIGDRRVALGARNELAATEAEPFDSMPLDWERAYGGRDLHAERRTEHATPRSIGRPGEDDAGRASYVRNRIGRGFFIDVDRDRLAGELLPNLMAPDDLVTPNRLLAQDAYDWPDRPVAAGYGPIDALTFPRCMHWFLQPLWRSSARPLPEVTSGLLSPSDLADREPFDPPDPRYHNCAAPGLAVCRLDGTERLKLWNLHARHELLEVDLPADKPRLVLQPPGCRPRELDTALATVFIEPGEDRITLTWAGSMEAAALFPEEMCAQMAHGVIWGNV